MYQIFKNTKCCMISTSSKYLYKYLSPTKVLLYLNYFPTLNLPKLKFCQLNTFKQECFKLILYNTTNTKTATAIGVLGQSKFAGPIICKSYLACLYV